MRFKEIILLSLLALWVVGCSSGGPQRPNATSQSAPDVKDSEGRTALMRAVDGGDSDGARKLVEQGADVNAQSPAGVTPLMNAAGMGKKELVELLIAKGADVNHKTSGNYTPLMQAALVGQIEIVKILLDAGADPSVADNSGRTAVRSCFLAPGR